MRHTITRAADGKCFTITTAGQGDVAGIVAFLDDLVADPQWRPGLQILLDHRRLDIASITAEGIERVSQHFRKIGPRLGNGYIALVMHKDIDFGIARAWELVTEAHVDMHIGVFRSLEEACRWLPYPCR